MGITACNPFLPALPAAHHGNMKAVSLQVLFVLRVLCLVTLAGGEPQLRLPARGAASFMVGGGRWCWIGLRAARDLCGLWEIS